MSCRPDSISNNLLLTGKPGVGKTTLIKQLIERLIQTLGVSVGGFWTEEMRTGGRRVGFKIKSFTAEDVLAHVDSPSPFRVGKYGVYVSAVERVGVTAIEQAIDSDDLIVMDELGRMELYSEKFQKTALRALDCTKPVLGVIQDRRNAFLDGIRSRKDVAVVRITLENRAYILEKLSAHLGVVLKG